jgi:hypothetical protein
MNLEWRKLRNDAVHNLYSSSDIIRMIKSGKVIAYMCQVWGKLEVHVKFWLKGMPILRQGPILKWILKK